MVNECMCAFGVRKYHKNMLIEVESWNEEWRDGICTATYFEGYINMAIK